MRHLFSRFSLVVATLLSVATAGPLRAATVDITVGDNFFSPTQITAAPGDQIVFTFNGNGTHPTVSDNNSWTSFQLDAGHRSHTLTLNTPGSYAYHCRFHGSAGGGGMSGTIVVQNTTGTRDDIPYQAELTAYPNPASASRHGEVTISFNQKAGADSKVRLLNVIGRAVRETTLKGAADQAHLTFSVADLPAGIYFYSLVVGDRLVETRRLVVQP